LKDEPLRALVAEGLAKLLLHQRIYAPRLLSRLILMWFNPVNKTDSALCRCLGVFFEVFAFSSKYQ
jgi:condensin complex subunit 3